LAGLSNVTREHIERARKIVPIVSVQNRYSFADREWDYVVDDCERNGIAFIPWFPLGAGQVAGEILASHREGNSASTHADRAGLVVAAIAHHAADCGRHPRSSIWRKILEQRPCGERKNSTTNFPAFPNWSQRVDLARRRSLICC